MDKVSITLDKETIDFDAAVKAYKEEMGEVSAYSWKDLDFEIDPDAAFFKDGKIIIYGELKGRGYLDIEVDLPIEAVTAIIEHYVKKMNKLRTVLEAVK